VSSGLRERLAELSLHRTSALSSERMFRGALAERQSEMVLALYLAVTLDRLQAGHVIEMEPGRHRSLTDHPVSLTAAPLAAAFADEFEIELPAAEVAGLTEYLLGLEALAGETENVDADVDAEFLDRIMVTAAEALHSTLTSDTELRRSLAHHLDRLSVRLRYGLPIHNPLLKEVKTRYPEVHAVAAELSAVVAEHFHSSVPEDETGYITMYLCGALERTRLKPGRRAIVVCPSGMATAWILVSRIQAEFPHLELTSVMSARAFSALEQADADLVITTVEMEPPKIPIVVVNPLLTPDDVKRVARHA